MLLLVTNWQIIISFGRIESSRDKTSCRPTTESCKIHIYNRIKEMKLNAIAIMEIMQRGA